MIRLYFALGLLLALSGTCSAAEPFLEKIDLFEAGKGGYARYHIPGVVVTAKGTALAWCEARKSDGDWATIDILMRRSIDGGRTWSDAIKIVDVPGPKARNPAVLRLKNHNPSDVTYNNPVAIADRDGCVHFLFCLEYMRVFYMHSDDDGVKWSTPVEITSAVDVYRQKANYDWKVVATGPNHGIQLATGRLVVPIWLSTGTGGNAHRPSVTSTITSDDGGKTWRAGEIAVPCNDRWINPSEAVAVELSDGRVMLNVRNEARDHRRLVTISKDGATGWSEPRFDATLVEPICMGSLVRYSSARNGDGGKPWLLFANPANLAREDGKETPGKSRDRKNLTLRLSEDDGTSWKVSKSIERGHAAYSDLAVARDGVILCFYGRGTKANFAGERLTIARANLDWLMTAN